MYCKTILFLVIDATLASDNSDIFQKEYQKKKSWQLMIRLEMKYARQF